MTLSEAIDVIKRFLAPAPGLADRLMLGDRALLAEAREVLRRSGLLVPPRIDELLRAGGHAAVGKFAADVRWSSFLERLEKHAQGLLDQQVEKVTSGTVPGLRPLLDIASAMGTKPKPYVKTKPDSMWGAMEARLRHY